MKVLIAVPCMDHVPALFAQSLACMKSTQLECQVAFQIGSLIYTSRNELASYAMKNGFDYVLWLDSDMVFSADLVDRMYKLMTEKDIKFLTGLYFRRVPPYTPVLFKTMKPSLKGWNFSHYETVPDELFEVGACGFGCVMMATEVLLDVRVKHGYLFDPMGAGGEDITFCWRARDCGYKIFCDPSLICGHVGNVVVTDTLYKALNNNGAEQG